MDEAYELDPAFPLIHLALAAAETDPERKAFFRDFDLNRLPDSCRYATALDRTEITLGAAEMCAEQRDWPRALVALDKYAKVGKANARSEALRVKTEKCSLPPALIFFAHTPISCFSLAGDPMSIAGVSSFLPLTSLLVLNTTFPLASKKSTWACPVYSSPDSDKTKVSWTRWYPVMRLAFHIPE